MKGSLIKYIFIFNQSYHYIYNFAQKKPPLLACFSLYKKQNTLLLQKPNSVALASGR